MPAHQNIAARESARVEKLNAIRAKSAAKLHGGDGQTIQVEGVRVDLDVGDRDTGDPDGGDIDGGMMSLCGPGELDCDGTCVDRLSDPMNCDACDTACEAETVCFVGACADSCGV